MPTRISDRRAAASVTGTDVSACTAGRKSASARDDEAIKRAVRQEAESAGFEACGFATLEDWEQTAQRLDAFIGLGHHGDMAWMADTRARRRDPRTLMADAASVVMLGINYGPRSDPRQALEQRERGVVSVYAQGKDYHDIVKGKLKQVARRLAALTGADVKVFVDTAPLMEKPLAARAGIGWQGKHTNLVSRHHGSWLFLGAIVTNLALPADAPEADHCGSCSACLDICPTNAFPAPYQLDARRCVSYLTIEHKGHIAAELRAGMGHRIYGCDDCLAVCPWNKFAVAAREVRFQARAETDNPPLAELLALDDAAFRKRFAGTPLKRTGRDRFVRNAVIAAGNSGNETLAPAVAALAQDGSALVRAMVAWAYPRLAPRDDARAFASDMLARETDDAVTAELNRVLEDLTETP